MGFYRYYSTQAQTRQFPHESLVFVLQRLNLIQHNVQNLHIRGFHSHPAHITNGHNDFFYYRLLQWFAARCAASPCEFALQAAITWLILSNSLRLAALIIGYERIIFALRAQFLGSYHMARVCQTALIIPVAPFERDRNS